MAQRSVRTNYSLSITSNRWKTENCTFMEVRLGRCMYYISALYFCMQIDVLAILF